MRWLPLLLLVACTPLPTVRASSDSANCEAWRSRYITWGAVAAASGALAGTGGLVTLAPGDDRTRVAIGATSLALSALGVAATFTAGEYASSYSAHGCVDMPR